MKKVMNGYDFEDLVYGERELRSIRGLTGTLDWFNTPDYVLRDIVMYTKKGNYAITFRLTYKGSFIVTSKDCHDKRQPRLFQPFVHKKFKKFEPALAFAKQILVGMSLME